jgi:hypothetical protein
VAYIQLHATKIKRLQKFNDFRKDLSLSVNEALGTLGSLWGEVIELAENGDITGWTPDYIVERAGLKLNPERVWTALVNNRWIDVRADGKVIMHDWLDWAGQFLRAKYAGDNREKLVEIWALHGKIYAEKGGRKKQDNSPIGSQLGTNKDPVTPKSSLVKEEVELSDPGDARGMESTPRGAHRHPLYASLKAAKDERGNLRFPRLRWVSLKQGIEPPAEVADTIAAVDTLIATYGLANVVAAFLSACIGKVSIAEGRGDASRSLAKANPEKAAQASKAAQTAPTKSIDRLRKL